MWWREQRRHNNDVNKSIIIAEERDNETKTLLKNAIARLIAKKALLLDDDNQGKSDNNFIELMEALTYLVINVPHRIRKQVSLDFLIENTQQALRTRNEDEFKLKKYIPFSVFLEYVLPFYALSEPLDSLDFRKRLKPFMRAVLQKENNLTLSKAAILLNLNAWKITNPPIVFEAAPPNKVNFYSVNQVIQAKRASCTGESVFLVAAFRSLGLPARVAGVPHWNFDSDKCPEGKYSPSCGNHNWVEVFVGIDNEEEEVVTGSSSGGWAFLDQNSGSKTLNTAWFFTHANIDPLVTNSKDHAIYAAGFTKNKHTDYFPLVFDPSVLVRERILTDCARG